jgi:predicted DNA binding CopG/RHH family protein
MAKKYYESSPRAARARKNAKPMRDERIDFSDIPQSTNEELTRGRRVGRPKSGNAKQLIAIRISPRLLAQLRRLAAKRDKPYQTLIHELLEQAARKSKVA